MILREIIFDKSEESKRDIIQKNLGREVILKDFHNDWCHGVLSTKEYDTQVYQMKISDSRKQRQMDYSDLIQLLVVEK